MVSVDGIGDMFAGSFSGAGATAMLWMGYLIWALVIGGALWFAYQRFTHKYRAEIYIRRATGKDGQYAIGKIINKRIKETKIKGVRKWQFMFSRKTMPPLDDKFIFPGNKIKLFQINPETFIPVQFNCGNPEAIMMPMPQDMKFWQTLEIQQASKEYEDPRVKYGHIALVLGTIVFCLIFAGITCYAMVKTGQIQTAQFTEAVRASGSGLQQFAQGLAPN